MDRPPEAGDDEGCVTQGSAAPSRHRLHAPSLPHHQAGPATLAPREPLRIHPLAESAADQAVLAPGTPVAGGIAEDLEHYRTFARGVRAARRRWVAWSMKPGSRQ